MLIAPSFADIFASNCVKIGLVPIVLPPDEVKALMESVARGGELTVDLEQQTIVDPAGRETRFEFDAFSRHCLLNGLDDIARALEHEDAIAEFERERPSPVSTLAVG